MGFLLKVVLGTTAGLLIEKFIRKKQMFDFSKQLKKFHDEHVRLSEEQQAEMRERRNTNQARLRTGLNAAEDPAPLEFIKQGSYAMKTMIQAPDNKYDIDDGVVFDEDDLIGPNGGVYSALDTRKMVLEALQDARFKTDPELKENCVRVHYNEGYHVDVPAYKKVKTQDVYGKDVTILEHAGASWQESAPQAVTTWFNQANKDLSPAEDPGQFRRVVRLLKMYTKRTNTSNNKSPSGFVISVLAKECYKPDAERLDRAVYNTIVAIHERLKYSTVVKHPILEKNLAEDNDNKVIYLKNQIETHIDSLAGLFDNDISNQDAAKIWGNLFKHEFFNDITAQKVFITPSTVNTGILNDSFFSNDEGKLSAQPREVKKEQVRFG